MEKNFIEQVKNEIKSAQAHHQPFSVRKIVYQLEAQKYKSLMGIFPQQYHQMKNKTNKRLYDVRAKALCVIYNSAENKNIDNLRILATHHLSCARMLKRYRKHILERW